MWKNFLIILAISTGILINGNFLLLTANAEDGTPAEGGAEPEPTAGSKSTVEDITGGYDESFKEMTFDVSQNLSLEGDEQGMSYFTDETNSPIVSIILSVIRFATKIIGAIAMLLFIIAGYFFMVGQGDDTQLTKGKDTLKYAIIGLAITFFSYIAITFIQSLFIK